MTSREQFEQKIQHEYGDDYLAVNDDGDYINWITSDLWEYWVASRAAVEIEIPPGVDVGKVVGSDGRIMYWIEEGTVRSIIESEGLKVKK